MTIDLGALLAHARTVAADERAVLALQLREELPAGSLLLETCHRVELYGPSRTLESMAGRASIGITLIAGADVARHLLRVAVGRDSSVVAEDQLLHQLRSAAQSARQRSRLGVDLDRLLDLALRAGRRARSWMPARHRSLAEVALDRVLGVAGNRLEKVLVVGAGEMGRRAARALAVRGAGLLVTSRTPERAATLAAGLNGRRTAFDPGASETRELSGVLLALAGPWQVGRETCAALLESGAWVIDLSAPSCLPARMAQQLGTRLVSIDDLAVDLTVAPSSSLIERLDDLVDATLGEYEQWANLSLQRSAARELAERAEHAQAAELTALWQRVPQLEGEQREEVARMAQRLTERLLRDPLERLHEDRDGRQASAARELFRL